MKFHPAASLSLSGSSYGSGPKRVCPPQAHVAVGEVLPAKADATAMAAETLYRERRLSVNAIAEKLHISKSTLYHYLRHRGVEIGS